MYIANNWTDEMMQVMTDKLVERKQRINETLEGRSTRGNQDSGTAVPDSALFKQLEGRGMSKRTVKRGN